MHLYKELAKKQKNHRSLLRNSEEFNFYFQNRTLLNGITIYKYFLSIQDDFDLIRANIILRALLNKKALDKAIVYAFKESKMKTDEVAEFVSENRAGLPYIVENNQKLYVPLFNRSINELYFKDFGKLLKKPYSTLINEFESSCVDSFEMYNFSLFDSLFSKLIILDKSDKLLIAYHFDFRTIYFINNQGRLDAKIALFDKYLHHQQYGHIIDRVKPVIEAYKNDDREGLYNALISEKLISKKLIYKIKHKEFKWKRKLQRKANRA